jgi:hypothetical protein
MALKMMIILHDGDEQDIENIKHTTSMSNLDPYLWEIESIESCVSEKFPDGVPEDIRTIPPTLRLDAEGILHVPVEEEVIPEGLDTIKLFPYLNSIAKIIRED